MLDLWHYRAGLRERAREVARELEAPGARVVIRAAIGSGRHSLARHLAALDVAVVEVPPFGDLDAPLHALVQLASHAGALEVILAHAARDPHERIRVAGQSLADRRRAVVMLLPVPRGGAPEEDDSATLRGVEEVLRVLASLPELRLAVLATSELRLRSMFAEPRTRTIDLSAPVIGAGGINASAVPAALAGPAAQLATWMAVNRWSSTPLEVRLQVGLIALGERPDGVACRLEALARKLARRLAGEPPLAAAVRRLMLARAGLPTSAVQAVTGVSPRWLPLLTACIGYGGRVVRVPDVTRQVLLEALPPSAPELEAAHAALADYHATQGGGQDLRGLDRARAIHWLEQVHHLARGGESTAARWEEQRLAGREQFWDRGRYLARGPGRAAEAARVYQRCIDELGPDPCSRHHLAWSLERAGEDAGPIRAGYEFAAVEEPDNPWWQQRWIRFLIAQGKLAEARAAWKTAIRAIDPEGMRLRRSPWLALNLHAGVARRWLALGHLPDAREVLAEVPQRWLDEAAELRELHQRLAAEEQSQALGEAVYPAGVAIEDRWRRPRGLRPARSGRALAWWAPGRVVAAGPAEVTVVVAPTREEVQRLTFDAAAWRAAAGEPPEDAAGFLELGRYEGGEEIVRAVPDEGRGAGGEPEDAPAGGGGDGGER